MNKSITKSGFILVMSMLMICALTVPAIARNTTDAECEACFGTMPPEITEIQTYGLKEASSYSGEVEEVVIWEDDFNTNPFNWGWYIWHPPAEMGWDGDSVYLPMASRMAWIISSIRKQTPSFHIPFCSVYTPHKKVFTLAIYYLLEA